MKKLFNYYLAIFGVLYVLFNIVSFVGGNGVYGASFWIGYLFITFAFIGQIVCSYFAFKSDDMKKMFYNVSLIKTSYTGMILSFIFGSLCMLIPMVPYWVGIILCAVVLAFNVIAVIKASAAIEIVSEIDNKIKIKTLFIKSLTVDAESLVALAKTEEIKAECKKVYEIVRYSDPMSHDALASVESEITVKFAALTEAVKADDASKVAETAKEVCVLVGERNNKCKLLK